MKRSLFFLVIALLITGLMISAAAAQSGTTEVGSAPSGQNSIEVVGQISQSNFAATIFGYVTYVSGLTPESLFAAGTDPATRGEGGALLTFYGTGNVYSRSVLEPLTTTNATATVDFYFNDAPLGSSFAAPDSFAGGTKAATLTMRLQNIVNVQSPNVAVFMSSVESVEQDSAPFTLNGETYSLGHINLMQHFSLFGQGFRDSIIPLAAHYVFVGNGTVIGDSLG